MLGFNRNFNVRNKRKLVKPKIFNENFANVSVSQARGKYFYSQYLKRCHSQMSKFSLKCPTFNHITQVGPTGVFSKISTQSL